MDNQENINNEETKKTLPAQATGEQIREHQEINRNKYQTEYNVYHDKSRLNKDSRIILYIILIVLILFILILIF